MYPMLHFHRKFSSSVTMDRGGAIHSRNDERIESNVGNRYKVVNSTLPTNRRSNRKNESGPRTVPEDVY